ncbi:MAG TPA: ABC transporter permease [Steroidobacteraceae bacterium]|nr:ABC transporter permease [Steroidobacteraceae bacterium]
MISVKRVGLVARRDFLVTVSSKGFLFGVLMMPLILVVLITLVPKLLASAGAQMDVQVALIDGSGTLADALHAELDPAALAAARGAQTRASTEQLGAAGQQVAGAAAAALPAMPRFQLQVLPPDATEAGEKSWLTDEHLGKYQRRALVEVPAAAVERHGDVPFATYQLYAPRNLPQDAESTLHGAVRRALIAARLRATGVDPAIVRSATEIAPTQTTLVSAGGANHGGGQVLNRLLPFIMGFLMFMGVMMGGQALMMSTVEEKSSRVVEVLLAAVAPLEMMWGKLLGQLGVTMVSMGVYVALGVLALLQFAMFGLIDPLLILYLFLFFLMSYLVYGALMLTVGAAVNQIADAQSLNGPIIILLVLPYILSPIIGGQPDAPFAVIASFVPPVNAFAMMARLASSSPPPVWQVLLSLAASLVAACAAVWFAAKVFRIGLLMHGKPPGFGTLVRWARMS